MRSPVIVLLSCCLPALMSCSDVSDAPLRTEAVKTSAPEELSTEETAESEKHASAQPEPEHRRHTANTSVAHATDGHPRTGHVALGSGSHAKEHRRSGGHGHADFSSAGQQIAIGQKVPDFEVTFNGRVWKLSDLQKDVGTTQDGTLVLTFWCSFCHSCRDVELDLDKLAQEYRGKAAVFALDASFGETREKVSAFAKERGLTVPIALSADGSVADIFGVNATTTTVVIDGKGVLRYLGQFGNAEHAFAADALKSVLAGDDVAVQRTRPKG